MSDSEAIRSRVRQRLAEQRALVRELLAQREQLQGSLFLRYGECGKENCVCRLGRRHGPYYVLSARGAGKGAFAYLAPAQLAYARRLVARYRAFRSGLRRVRGLNLELVDLLRRYRDAMTRRGRRRLGLSPRL